MNYANSVPMKRLAAVVFGAWMLSAPVLADDIVKLPKKEFAADKGPENLDVSAYPDEIKEAYKVFSSKCSKCHTLARPINTDMTVDSWKMYVKRMSNKPDSAISPDQAKTVYKFLKFRQGEKDAKKGVGAK